MTSKSELEAIQKAVTDAWDFWLSQHDISVPEVIEMAVKNSWDRWLSNNEDKISDLVAERHAAWLTGPWVELLCPTCWHQLTSVQRDSR